MVKPNIIVIVAVFVRKIHKHLQTRNKRDTAFKILHRDSGD